MLQSTPIDAGSETFWDDLNLQLEALLQSKRSWFTHLANTSALLFQSMPHINWAGFYLFDADALLLGPFQGKVACDRIDLSRGVCGHAARTRQTVLVPDVHAFPGHIACDPQSMSEVVVPMIDDAGRLLGVLDVDAPRPGRFSPRDAAGLEAIVRTLILRTDWPASFV